jgi:hypothetical protein
MLDIALYPLAVLDKSGNASSRAYAAESRLCFSVGIADL